jgi:hypothetical protein
MLSYLVLHLQASQNRKLVYFSTGKEKILVLVTKHSKIWVRYWYPGSEILKKPVPDPGSGVQKGTGNRIPNTGYQYTMRKGTKQQKIA